MKTNLRPGLAVRVPDRTQNPRAQRLQDMIRGSNRFSKDETQSRSAAEVLGPFLAILVVAVWMLGMFVEFQLPLTILTVIGFVLAVLGLFSPTLGLLGIGMLATLDAATRNFLLTGGLLRWNSFNYWLLVVIALNLVFLLRLNNPQTRLLQLFVALLAVELLISSNISSGFRDILNIVAAFGLLVYFARGHQIKGGMYWMGIVSGLVSGLGGLIYYLQFDKLPYVNPNSWAFFPMTGLFAVSLGYPSSKDHRLGNFTLLLLAAVNFLWIFLSGSRGSMLVGALCILFLFLWTRKFSWRVAFIAAGWLALGIFSLQFSEQQSYAAGRLEKLFNDQYTLEQKTSGRSDIAQAGLEIFMRNPLGVGTGDFREAVVETNQASSEVAAHSGWIKILAENGIPGIVLLAAYIFSFLFVGINRRDRDLFLLGLLVTSSFAAALLSKEFQGKGLWFFAAGATVMLHSQEIATVLTRKTRLAAQLGMNKIQSYTQKTKRWQRDN